MMVFIFVDMLREYKDNKPVKEELIRFTEGEEMTREIYISSLKRKTHII